MDVEEKEKRLGELITSFKWGIKELNALVNPSTPLEKAAERKRAIEYFATHLKEMEKEANLVTDATMHFWGSVVQYEQSE